MKRDGVNVPGVLGTDWEAGWLVLEYVEGRTVRRVLDEWAKAKSTTTTTTTTTGDENKSDGQGEGESKANDPINNLMRLVGTEVGKLHNLGVCHGDLTTSNIMLRTPSSPSNSSSPSSSSENSPDSLDGTVYLIDFGLTSASIQDEDKAVDLYVLERAFAATHPAAEPLFQQVLRAYGETGKGAKSVLRRLEDVRLRGRKRSMLG